MRVSKHRRVLGGSDMGSHPPLPPPPPPHLVAQVGERGHDVASAGAGRELRGRLGQHLRRTRARGGWGFEGARRMEARRCGGVVDLVIQEGRGRGGRGGRGGRLEIRRDSAPRAPLLPAQAPCPSLSRPRPSRPQPAPPWAPPHGPNPCLPLATTPALRLPPAPSPSHARPPGRAPAPPGPSLHLHSGLGDELALGC